MYEPITGTNAASVVGYIYDADIHCIECASAESTDDPIFADAEFDYAPACCDCNKLI